MGLYKLPQMSELEAKQEATRRWRVHGGWAARAPDEKSPCRVGVRQPTANGTQRVILGMGLTFERAFDAAERKIARAGTPRATPGLRKRKPLPGALPQEEMPL